MRVVAGRWRGHRLVAGQGREIRPTSDRVKEAIFSILGPWLAGAELVDLCCGTGGLGIEALSRGAHRVIFVDRSAAALRIARQNLEHLSAPLASYSLQRAEALAWLTGRLRGRPAGGGPFLLVADPPYQSGLGGQLATVALAQQAPTPLLAAVIEGPRGVNVEQADGPFSVRRRRHGETELLVLVQERVENG
jgi:16S rRNA (guanine966-N2)-methyltransferase